ncbi:MAG: efflux RND transporter periplasmic adaptor subunit [Betaproteobacteria bacterium]
MSRKSPASSVPIRNALAAAAARSLLALSLAALIAGCGKAPGPAPGAGGGLPVTVVQVALQRVPNLLEAVGQTEGSKDVEVRARVSGILEKTLYREGDRVAAGATLFVIDRAPFENALAQARASLAQERVRLEQVQREAGRLKQLVEQRAISQREYDDATSAQKTSETLIAAAEARVRDAQLNLSYTNVTAPISGISGRALRSDGSLVASGNDSALLTTISQSDPIWVRFSVGESEHAQLRSAGRKAEVRLLLSDGKEYPATGRLNFTSSTVDTKLGTIGLRAEFGNPGQALLPGQFVRVRLSTGESEGILVPQVAVVQNDQGRFVWVAGPDDKAVLKPVDAANWLGSDWRIKKGLAAGDRVIVDNLLKLRPGAPVQPTVRGAAAAAPTTAPTASTTVPATTAATAPASAPKGAATLLPAANGKAPAAKAN